MDPLAIINFGKEDFAQPTSQPIQPPQPGSQVFGRAERYKDYFDEFDKAEDEVNTNVVMIPRYAGPKSTRCDKYKLEGNMFRVTGLPNHAQQSSVYLNQTYTFYMYSEELNSNQGVPWHFMFDVRPFFIQRQWERTRFEAPQADNFYDMDTRMMVKLAPYLTSKQCMDNKVKTKVTISPDSTPQNMLLRLFKVEIESYEPLLGFQTGWHDLDAIRPFNQQHSKFPLALQDYELSVFPREFVLQNHIFSRNLTVNDDTVDNRAGAGNIDLESHDNSESSMCDPRRNIWSERIVPEPPELISYSDNNARQANKSVSSVMLHAPRIEVTRKQLRWLNKEVNLRDQYWAEFKNKTREIIIATDYQETGSPVPDEPVSVKINTPYGLPSYFVIYLEDKGSEVTDYNSNFVDQAGLVAGLGGNPLAAHIAELGELDKRKNFAPCHPKATGIRIKVFDDTFPITAQLDKEELEYITHKNSHKYCDFRHEMTREPIILLKLEDLGLGNCEMGYPYVKRQTIDVEITKILLHKGAQYTYLNEAPKIELTVGLVYENFVCEGSAQRVEFLWR